MTVAVFASRMYGSVHAIQPEALHVDVGTRIARHVPQMRHRDGRIRVALDIVRRESAEQRPAAWRKRDQHPVDALARLLGFARLHAK